jgi:hypothetical protein
MEPGSSTTVVPVIAFELRYADALRVLRSWQIAVTSWGWSEWLAKHHAAWNPLRRPFV